MCFCELQFNLICILLIVSANGCVTNEHKSKAPLPNGAIFSGPGELVLFKPCGIAFLFNDGVNDTFILNLQREEGIYRLK